MGEGPFGTRSQAVAAKKRNRDESSDSDEQSSYVPRSQQRKRGAAKAKSGAQARGRPKKETLNEPQTKRRKVGFHDESEDTGDDVAPVARKSLSQPQQTYEYGLGGEAEEQVEEAPSEEDAKSDDSGASHDFNRYMRGL